MVVVEHAVTTAFAAAVVVVPEAFVAVLMPASSVASNVVGYLLPWSAADLLGTAVQVALVLHQPSQTGPSTAGRWENYWQATEGGLTTC